MTTSDTDIINRSLDILVVLNTTVKNFRLYPPTSSTVINTLEKLHRSFLDALEYEDQVLFAESEKNLLICGIPLSQKDQERPHVASFLGIMIGLGLKSISINKGMEKEELSRFVNLLSLKPEVIAARGGLHKLLSEQDIVHIVPDQKVYVAMDKDRKILSSLDITDEQLTSFFMMTHPDMDIHSQEFQDMARDPRALSKAFETGLAQMIAQKETLSSVQLSGRLDTMLSLLDKMTGGFSGEDRNILSQSISRSIAASDPAIAGQLNTSNMEHLFGGLLIQYLMTELSGKPGTGEGEGGGKGEGEGAGTRAAGGGGEGEPGGGKSKLLQVAGKFNLHLANEKTLMDKGLMDVLPKIIEQLIIQKEQQVLEDMIRRLTENLKSNKSEVRASAIRGLADVLERIPAEQKDDALRLVSAPLVQWLKTEDTFSGDYTRMYAILKNVIEDHIKNRRLTEAFLYLEPFCAIAEDNVPRENDIKKAATEILRQLSSVENIEILKEEIPPEDNKDQSPAGLIFTALGAPAVDLVLDELRHVEDSNDRVKMMHLITAAKEKAMPAIIGRIRKTEPWYYLRNLAYMIGQIGNEENARAIAPLLQHENIRLRQEVLKSIYRIGGNLRGKLLIASLPEADDEFKLNIVDALGQAKATDAVETLLGLLKDRPLIVSSARQNLEEKICTALGAIGAPEAIGPLSDIAETKAFLVLRSYPDKVKSAAAQALVILRRKVAESEP